MSFIVRTLARTIVSTAVSTAVTLVVKKVLDERRDRKPAVPRLTDERKPARKVKAPAAE